MDCKLTITWLQQHATQIRCEIHPAGKWQSLFLKTLLSDLESWFFVRMNAAAEVYRDLRTKMYCSVMVGQACILHAAVLAHCVCMKPILLHTFVCTCMSIIESPKESHDNCDKELFAFAKAKSRWKCDACGVFKHNSIASPWLIFMWWGDVQSFPDCSSNQAGLGIEADKKKHWIL